jgi:hypothetical protein
VKANETILQPLIEGAKQYVVPLFQRPYSWTKKEWTVLWEAAAWIMRFRKCLSKPTGLTGLKRLLSHYVIKSVSPDRPLLSHRRNKSVDDAIET